MTEGPWGHPEGAKKRDAQEKLARNLKQQIAGALKTVGTYEVEEDFRNDPELVFKAADEGEWPAISQKIKEIVGHADALAKQNAIGSIVVDESGNSITVRIKS